jgi:type III restriction enzyme
MELKSYQQKVINDLETFLEYAARFPDLRQAFHHYWKDKGVTQPEVYKNNVPKVPHVCVKVPTAGGKTFIAANALRPIFDQLERVDPTRRKVVIWLVPSRTILEQTIKNLSDTAHPYRQKLNTHFNGRVGVYTKEEVLQGADFSPETVREQLSIIVLSFDSLRTQNKDGRKAYQENGYLAAFASQIDKDVVIENTDETALINVLRGLNPVLIVDESHNAETNLSVKMLVDLNPAFILDLTATPRDNSNIISYVDALELKKQNMVKLPVIVTNFKDKTDVLNSALLFRRKLEEAAQIEEANGGKHIRPIILFQAQPKSGENNTTFEKLKEQLVNLGIPPDEIKIKTADINELKGIDLMSKDCPVRYIITINALKEGWDCPFAYVLASLANKSSAVDVEQVLGRVLRQPYTQPHKQAILNTSYVFTASGQFLKTLDSIVAGLNHAGFSKRDCRAKDLTESEPLQPIPTQTDFFAQLGFDAETTAGQNNADEIDVSKVSLTGDSADIQQRVNDVVQQAVEHNTLYEQQASAIETDNFVPTEIKDKMNVQPMKEIFREQAKQILLPQFFYKVRGNGFFDEGENHILFENDELLRDFPLSKKEIDIQFENLDSDAYIVDLERLSEEDCKPTFKKMDAEKRTRFNEYILGLPDASKLEAVNQLLCKLIGKMYPIDDKEIKKYVQRVLEAMPLEQLHDCLERDYIYSARIKQKIIELATVEKEKGFSNWLDTDKIIVKPSYSLPETIIPANNARAITKSLYANEESMNEFEARVINDIANLENVLFWHRNIERKGFRLNGFINHYPDFIVVLKSGRILLVESKGDDRDNSDSQRKIKLGERWESKAGNNFRYLMIFDNIQLDGAHRLNDAVKLISQM